MTNPYRMKRLGIINHVGGIWTAETFDTVEAGQACIDAYSRRWPSMDLSRHRVVPVRVTVSLIKPKAPAINQQAGGREP